MATYEINCSLYAGVSGQVELPEGKTWRDVQDWYVKWDTLFVTFKSGEQSEHPLNSDGLDAIDWKRPRSVEVYAVDEETGETLYDTEIAST